MSSPCWAPGKEQMLKNDLLEKNEHRDEFSGCTYPKYENCSIFSICAFMNLVTNIC